MCVVSSDLNIDRIGMNVVNSESVSVEMFVYQKVQM